MYQYYTDRLYLEMIEIFAIGGQMYSDEYRILLKHLQKYINYNYKVKLIFLY